MAKDPKPRLRNRMKFAKDDPLRYLHVPKSERLDDDGVAGDDHDAVDEITHDRDRDFDRDEVRSRGGVVSQEDLL